MSVATKYVHIQAPNILHSLQRVDLLDTAESQFGLRDIASVAKKSSAKKSRKRPAGEMSPASKIAAKNSHAEKWKEMKKQKREIKVLVTPQRD